MEPYREPVPREPAPVELEPGRWVCSDCNARCDAAGDCTKCGEGPLLDSHDALARTMLVERDAEGARKRRDRLMVVTAALCTPVVIVIWFVFGRWAGKLGSYGSDPVAWFAFALSIGSVLGVYGALRARYPYRPRFADLRPRR